MQQTKFRRCQIQGLPVGLYVAMNGRVFDWDNVRKNRDIGEFEELRVVQVTVVYESGAATLEPGQAEVVESLRARCGLVVVQANAPRLGYPPDAAIRSNQVPVFVG